MKRAAAVLLSILGSLAAQDGVVFRSSVSLVRVDAQVVDRNNRAVTGLEAEDFVLLEEGQPQQIRNFEREQIPMDVLLLLDVSGSMRPHVERVAAASQAALQVLGVGDRVAIMVFDRATRVRLPFQSNRREIERALDYLIRQETFNGGTDITRALVDAANYMRREARAGARRAIVILTDDQTERERDEARVGRALASADTVLSALIAPDALRRRRLPSGGGGWPSSGPLGGPLGGIILGPRFPGRIPGGAVSATRSAGTEEIARASGGDSMRVDDAEALENTFARLRQRYALHFHVPEDAQPGQERNIEVRLSAQAQRRYPGAEVRYRRVYFTPGAGAPEAPVLTESTPQPDSEIPITVADREPPASSRPGWRRAGEAPTETPQGEPEKPASRGGWRRATPEDLQP